MMNDSKLRDIVNSSGFPLQIGLQSLIASTYAEHRWKVLFSEHSWANFNTDTGGFIDLILEDAGKNLLLVVECKRVQNSSWIFLQAEPEPTRRRHVKVWCTEEDNGNVNKFGWFDKTIDPATIESAYCVVPGQDSKSKPMLERVAADVVQSTEGFAIEDQSYHKGLLGYQGVLGTPYLIHENKYGVPRIILLRKGDNGGHRGAAAPGKGSAVGNSAAGDRDTKMKRARRNIAELTLSVRPQQRIKLPAAEQKQKLRRKMSLKLSKETFGTTHSSNIVIDTVSFYGYYPNRNSKKSR